MTDSPAPQTSSDSTLRDSWEHSADGLLTIALHGVQALQLPEARATRDVLATHRNTAQQLVERLDAAITLLETAGTRPRPEEPTGPSQDVLAMMAEWQKLANTRSAEERPKAWAANYQDLIRWLAILEAEYGVDNVV